MRHLLDTCAWIDALLAPEKLSDEVRNIFGLAEPLGLSTISVLELARKEATGELIINMPLTAWLEKIALPKRKIRLLTISPEISIDATRLPEPFVNRQNRPHKDPADQIIIATARRHDLTLVTSDRILLDYPHVRTLPSR